MKKNRIEIAEDTLAIIETGEYRNNLNKVVSIKEDTENAIEKSVLFHLEDFPSEFELTNNDGETKIELTEETTLEAAKRVCAEDAKANPYVLNFASAKNPGGGFLSGSQAQEESLARSSSLYPCLTKHKKMYDYNRKSRSTFYSDYMIYSPEVPVFRNDDGSLIQNPYLATFMTSPAVNAGILKQRDSDTIGQIDAVNKERARKFLWVANIHKHQTLILGAWGCGVFKNDPSSVANLFNELLEGEFKNCFERVTIAIYDRTQTKKVYNAFSEVFGKE